MPEAGRVVLTGGAGLVGQNLIHLLRQKGYREIVSIDKHRANNAVLRSLHPEVTVIDADLAEPGDWETHFAGAQALVMLQAQIGGLIYDEFDHNTLKTTERVLAAAKRAGIPYMVHISSSVVHSRADDYYSRSKRAQEAMVVASGMTCAILRPTLITQTCAAAKTLTSAKRPNSPATLRPDCSNTKMRPST